MKSKIHPKYHLEAQVVCSCGNTFTTGSTKSKITVEVCYKCHPIYTGEKRYIDTLGRVDKFQRKQKKSEDFKKTTKPKKKRGKKDEDRRPRTLKELLSEM